MRLVLLATLVGLLSSGWLVPVYLGVSSYMGGVENLLHQQEALNSFPHFEFARRAIGVGMAWGWQ